MPMNLDSVGAVSESFRSSWTSKDALLYALGVGAGQTDPTGFELEFTTENSTDIAQKVLPTLPVVISMGGGPGLPSWGEFDFRMLLHAEQGVTVHGPDPARRRGRVGRPHRRHLRQGQGRDRAPREQGDVRRQRQARVRHALRRVHPRRRWLRRVARRRGRRPAEDARAQSRSRGHVRDARRPGAALPPERRPQPAALGSRRSRSSPASTGRSSTGSAPTASPAARSCTSSAVPTSPGSRRMDSRFSKPVTPGDTLTVRMWDDGKGRALYQTVDPSRHGRDRRRRLHLRIAKEARTGVSWPRIERRTHASSLYATLAAPMRGPLAPNAPGTMRVPREKSRRQLASSSRLRGGEERVAVAERDRAADDGEGEVEKVRDRRHRAADERSRSLAYLERRVGGRCGGDARDRGARRFRFEAAARSAGTDVPRRARRSRGRCDRRCRARRRGAGRRGRCRRRRRWTPPCRCSCGAPRAAPLHPSPSASALASLSTHTGRLACAASRARSGNARHAGMLSGDTCSPFTSIGPPQPTPTATAPDASR